MTLVTTSTQYCLRGWLAKGRLAFPFFVKYCRQNGRLRDVVDKVFELILSSIEGCHIIKVKRTIPIKKLRNGSQDDGKTILLNCFMRTTICWRN